MWRESDAFGHHRQDGVEAEKDSVGFNGMPKAQSDDCGENQSNDNGSEEMLQFLPTHVAGTAWV